MSESVELLFFDTFAHDNSEEINLDLVQFPKPVYVTEVRIIPLGARVQADFPGGVRLGATNPSQFQIELFVNDLGKPGASTFESLGGFEYNQNDCINLDCISDKDNTRRIPTDGLVLKGWYTTITLAVYGTLTNNISEQIIQPVVNPALPNQSNAIVDTQQILSGNTMKNEWNQENLSNVPIEYNQNTTNTDYQQQYNQQSENYSQEYSEYYSDVPKDPRNYHHTPEPSTTDWTDNKQRPRTNAENERERDRNRELNYQKTGNSTTERDQRLENREKNYQHGHSRERETRSSRDYRDVSRERDWEQRTTTTRRGSGSGGGIGNDDRKRPRTPPTQSPKRPHTPHNNSDHCKESNDNVHKEEIGVNKNKEEKMECKKDTISCVEEQEQQTELQQQSEQQPLQQLDVEEFEPILSDEDILDEEIDYDYTSYTNNDDLIKLFIPGVTILKRFEKTPLFKIEKNTINIDENLRTTIGIIDDYFKSSITKYTLDEYEKLNTEIKEEFIHLCEKLISIFGTIENFCEIINIYTKLQTIDLNNFTNNDDCELFEQVKVIVETLIDWLKIALNYEMANLQTQPPYKIRHIKCGVKLIEFCSNSIDFIKLLYNNNINIPKLLLDLYDKEYMALSIRLMILKALDTYLLHKYTIERFLFDDFDENNKENGYHDRLRISKNNGYRILVEKLMKNPSVRLKFSLNSILKKLNLYEICYELYLILLKLRNNDFDDKDIELIIDLLNQILNYFYNGEFILSQPKRFLPVSGQFEINRSEINKTYLINYFYMFDLLQCFFLLLTKLNLITIKIPIYDIINELLKTIDGLTYLTNNCELLNLLVKYLIKNDDELQYSIQNFIDIKSHNLGLILSYKIECLYCIENLKELGRKYKNDFDQFEIIDQLHQFYCLTFTYKGKLACCELLTINSNIECLLQFFDDLCNLKDKSDSLLNKYKKSPSIGYIIDLIYFTITTISNIEFLLNYHKQIIQIINYIDIFDDTLQLRLNEIKNYLMPFINLQALNYDNIAPIMEIINKNLDNVTLYPGQLITSLRLLEYFGINPYNMNRTLIENPLCNYVELKYKHVILQIFSLDGTAILMKLLQKICEYYEQPSLHTPIFVSNYGLLIINTIKPCIVLLKQILTYVIQCRNTNFKDLTSIPILLHTYNLLNTYPNTCNYYQEAQEICKEIIETLLVFTQPISDEINEKDSLNKTLWTLMCNEIIKFTLTKPCNFLSGLLIFSELLPLPLPIQCKYELSKDEVMWLVNLRRLWSAHLYPLNTVIQEMIEKLCTTSCLQLLNLLKRICIQLSDLTANTSILIVRTILDLIYKNLFINDDQFIVNCNNHILRLLNFLACLVTHNTLKCTVLHLIHTKNNDKYTQLIQIFGQILKNNTNTNNHHIQSQECILSIIQSFCDIEITLLQNPCETIDTITSDIYLINALPNKDYLIIFITMIIDHITIENSFVTYLPAIRTLLLLTEHDYGFYHLKELLLKRNDSIFTTILKKLVKSFSKDNTECLSTLNTLAEFIRVCITNEDVSGVETTNLLYTPRKMKMSLNEIKLLIGWKCDNIVDDNGDCNENKHPLLQLEEILKELTCEDINFESLLESVTSILKILRNDSMETKEIYTEPILPEPESLLIQYSGRSIYSSTDICDERLTIRYWLSIPNDESENETIQCDLTEIIRQFLPPDLSITREIEKLYRISPLENTDEKEKNDNDQKAKTKKPFITPVRSRGFPRTIPQRSDLFRSRPPNTSRPPSLHVDDFVALETCGAQPTGPTGYNKFSRELLASNRIARGSRGRAFVASERSWWGTNHLRGPYP